ncbi:MAG TPA: metallophosphoesterase family protein [Chthoniobacteraceae bacterium]|jgi:predicted phosphodiesterase|nr:metallophosphoesterase family protein [Chthoniobacteraceae bacterium]
MPPKSRARKAKPVRKPKAPPVPSHAVAVLSDIHSNLHALMAVVELCKGRGIHRFWCLGDIVGYGAYPAECLKLIRALDCLTVLGNHDYYVAGGDNDHDLNDLALAGIEHSKKALTPAARKWLRERPEVIVAETFTLVHSSLPHPLEWDYVLGSADARPTLHAQTTPVCFYGHTHVPKLFAGGQSAPPEKLGEGKYRFDRAGRALVNPGSVGQPRNEDPRAQFVIYDPRELTAEFMKVEYDVEGAAGAILAAGLPEYLGERLLYGV